MHKQKIKKRNPVVMAARNRHGGVHRKTEKALRRQAAMAVAATCPDCLVIGLLAR